MKQAAQAPSRIYLLPLFSSCYVLHANGTFFFPFSLPQPHVLPTLHSSASMFLPLAYCLI